MAVNVDNMKERHQQNQPGPSEIQAHSPLPGPSGSQAYSPQPILEGIDQNVR